MSVVQGWPTFQSVKLTRYEVAHASMARTLARLEIRGLIRRQRRGRVTVGLTREGRRAADRVLECLPRVEFPRAVHEAGHAVVANSIGLEVTGIHVVARFNSDGRVGGATFVSSCIASPVLDAAADILVAWGGVCAEHVVLGASIDERIKHGGAQTDFLGLKAAARKAGLRANNVRDLREHALRIVRTRQTDVKHVARALQTHKLLGGKDLEVVLAGN